MSTTLLIARHGNTFSPGDVVRRVGVRTDIPLAPKGKAQGAALGLYLKEKNLIPDVVFASTLKRTQETAEEALKAMGAAHPINIDPLFNEVDYGSDENRPEEEVLARIGADALKAWDEKAIVPPGWCVDVHGIIHGWAAFADNIIHNYVDKKILVVTSNGIARFAPSLAEGMEAFAQQHSLKLSTGAFGILTYDNAWRIKDWNVKPPLKA
ncbi:MAG: histidine phosphatase family protein [Alphaproteobacteria bacterium]|nr:histidine phosphatase family protein [Alphaproteobacteria bacterium]